MSKYILIVVCLALVLAMMAGCTPPVKTVVPVTVSCEQFSQQKNIEQSVNMKVGNRLVLTLCANQTTGFQWGENAQVSDPQVLQQVNYKYAAPNTELAGAPGNSVWTFDALQNGISTVYLEYSRPWQGGEKAVQTFKLTVTVQ
jgi:predicted secreted protein